MSPTPEKLMQYLLMLRNSGVTDKRVLHAMELIPRDPFATGAFQERAYEDTALPIATVCTAPVNQRCEPPSCV